MIRRAKSARDWGLVADPCAAVLTISPQGRAQAKPGAADPLDLQGVYQSIPDKATLPGGLKNAGSPSGISVLPAFTAQMRAGDEKIDLKKDPAGRCALARVARSG